MPPPRAPTVLVETVHENKDFSPERQTGAWLGPGEGGQVGLLRFSIGGHASKAKGTDFFVA